MAHSVEIRVPLIDVQLLRDLAPMLNSRGAPGKLDFALTATAPLPEAILSRNKTGFVVPIRQWMAAAAGAPGANRGLRGWARMVYSTYNSTLPSQSARAACAGLPHYLTLAFPALAGRDAAELTAKRALILPG